MRIGSTHWRRSLNRGFTLLELVIVMVLIAIMTAMIVPEMRGTFEGELLRATSRELIQGLNLTYSQSVSGNIQHRFVIDPKEHAYRIERLARREDEGVGFIPLRDVGGGSGHYDERVKVEIRDTPPQPDDSTASTPTRLARGPGGTGNSGRQEVHFHPDGTAQNREILLRDASGFGLVLRINPITAQIKVVELKREDAP